MTKTSDKYWSLCVYLVLMLGTFALFWQVHDYDFVNYDDNEYVTENLYVKAGLTRQGIAWAFTTGSAANWHPLTWLSHMLDCRLFGLNAGPHHLTSLLLHVANTLLLLWVLRAMTGTLWPGAFVAAAFAIHPLHVESVAWISERKDVLSTLFWLLTMIAYLRYLRRPALNRYLLTLLAFVLGLMAKPMLITLPFVLLLLDYWPLGRFHNALPIKDTTQRGRKSPSRWPVYGRLLWEKLPFFILSAISSLVTFFVQRTAGAVTRIDAIPVKLRIFNALVSYVTYIWKMIWPGRLAVLYPFRMLPIWQAAAAGVLLLAVSLSVFYTARSHRYLLVGWLWYLGTLLPVIGLVQVGFQALADRYTYIPLIGLFIIIAWGFPAVLAKWRYKRAVLAVSAGGVLFALTACTSLQLRHWRNSVTLFERALDVTVNNHVAHGNLANAMLQQRRFEETIAHCAEVLKILPDHADTYCILGDVFIKQGKIDEAIAHYNKALHLKPDYVDAYLSLGDALVLKGSFPEAVTHYTEALRLSPGHAGAHYNLAIAFAQQGSLDKVIEHCTEALRLQPCFAEAHYNLAKVFTKQGKRDQAVSHYTEALRLNPRYTDAQYNLAIIFAQQGSLDKAVSYYTKVLLLDPNHVGAHNNLGVLFARKGRLNEAITHYKKAAQLRPDSAQMHRNLADALVLQRQLDQAAAHYTEALRLEPNVVDVHMNLAGVLTLQGSFDDAVTHYTKALQLQPNSPDIYHNLANTFARQGNFDEAIAHFNEALRLNPEFVTARRNLAAALTGLGSFNGAIEQYRIVLQSEPRNADVYNKVGALLAQQGKTGQAITHFTEALRLKPDWPEVLNNLAWLLATHREAEFRDPAKAVQLAERACELTGYEYHATLDTLAAAYAAAGQFPQAIGTAEKAIKLALSDGRKDTAQEIQARIELYKTGQCYHAPASVPDNTSP